MAIINHNQINLLFKTDVLDEKIEELAFFIIASAEFH